MIINIFTIEAANFEGDFYEKFMYTLEVENITEANKIIESLNSSIGRVNGCEYYWRSAEIMTPNELMEKINKPVIVRILLLSNKKDFLYIVKTSQNYFLPLPDQNGEFEDINYINHWGPGKVFKFWITLDQFINMTEAELLEYGLKLIGDRMPEGFEYRERL